MANPPRHLQEQLKNRKVIPFVGAGVSMAVRAKETGEHLFPSWKELLERAVLRLQNENQPAYAETVNGLIRIGSGEYLEAVKRARQGLTGEIWFRFLKEQLDIPNEAVDDASLDLVREIWRLGSPLIITTNYDRVLHWACPTPNDLSSWDIEAPVEQLQALGGDTHRPTVWHLHGSIDNTANLVLTPDGYARLYPEAGDGETRYKGALTALHHFMLTHTLLFVGFSFDDDYLGMQLSGLDEIFQGATGTHYVLTRESHVEQTRSLIKASALPVEVVPFTDFGEPLLDLVRSMGQVATEGESADSRREVGTEEERAALPP